MLLQWLEGPWMVSSSADKTFIKTGQLPQTDLLLDAEETPEEEAVPL